MTTSNIGQMSNSFCICYVILGLGSFFYLIWNRVR